MSRKALLKRAPKAIEINGETVMIRSLTLREANAVDAMSSDGSKSHAVLEYLVACAVTDADGNPVFAAGDPELSDIPIDTIRAIADEVKRLSSGGNPQKIEKN